ncbi:alpha-amylase family glycosyl hydrolase [Hymenobacter weizhouensis]|uniref:alpha-amylase family glycosyl hydrolase n=1 Tax=Hymenobacter sp. YIM 151500-1 TaxID=2987689 RepID=UPI002226C95C|nr:alpha-amylase family glycosyl hydrolase [Hymenobacter sp. YIM 151500-1]UYZ63405.1 alpha-amylase family glycosyl hydrolase [Hymenobacter sp. YIM 151500-1]
MPHLRASLLLSGLLALAACRHNPPAETAVTCAPAAPPEYTIRHPAWADSASIYEVNIRQYTPEGTFRAFERHLPRLQQMGVGILWLMPVQPIGQKNRKGTLGSQYSIRDYRAVNPEFGTLDDLRHLIREAHGRGMHVILDWVANHTAWDSRLVQQHPDWFTRDAQGRFVPPVADWQDVIDLDYRQPELRRYMAETMRWWVQDVGFDGFRADVAGLVPMDFWNQTRRELEQVKPVFMLAEWDELHDPPFLKKGQFDPNTGMLEQAFDATYALRLRYLLDSISRGRQPVAALDRYRQVERARYPATAYLMYFTSSHDINSWDGTEYERLGPDAQPQAVLTALLPGIPMVYSGQEAALKKRLRFFDKDIIPWNNFPLQNFYTRLLQLKRRHPALRNGDPCSQFTRLASPEGTYAFTRTKNNAAVFTAVNFTDASQSMPLPAAPAGRFRDVFSGETVELKPQEQLAIPARGWRVLEKR